MTAHVSVLARQDPARVADQALGAAAKLWFGVAVIGMWIFAYYVAAYYGGVVGQGGLEGLNNTHLPKGYIPGDTIGNVAIAAHLFLAVYIIVGGPLQLMLGAIITGGGPLQRIPKIRARARSFHHWNGRIYVLTVIATSIAGLYMVLTRGILGGTVGDLGMSLNAVLIMICAAMALRYAIARDIVTHRRWALRLFLVVSGVWFFRVGLMLWVFLTGGVGIDFETFTGPFLTFWFFGQYLLPLAVLELYLRTQEQGCALHKFAMAAGLLVVTALMGVGIYAAYMLMWLPRL